MTKDRVFELISGHPALDLVNTLDWRFRDTGSEDLLGSYLDLLSFIRQSGLITAPQARRLALLGSTKGARVLKRVLDLREAAAQVFYAVIDGGSVPQASIKRLEILFRDARSHRHLVWRAPRLEWEIPQSSLSVELPLWILSLSTEELMKSDDMQRLRACNNPGCRWLFLDTSKNHTRRWCDMKVCGNRMKARRFKALHRAN